MVRTTDLGLKLFTYSRQRSLKVFRNCAMHFEQQVEFRNPIKVQSQLITSRRIPEASASFLRCIKEQNARPSR